MLLPPCELGQKYGFSKSMSTLTMPIFTPARRPALRVLAVKLAVKLVGYGRLKPSLKIFADAAATVFE